MTGNPLTMPISKTFRQQLTWVSKRKPVEILDLPLGRIAVQ